jgi:hypothetical protein
MNPTFIKSRERVRPRIPSWSIPRLWAGETVFILGGGPSLADVNFDLIKHRRIIAVNNAYGDKVKDVYVPRDWVDLCFFGDERWFSWHKKALAGFKGLLVSSRSSLHGRKGIKAVCRGQSEGIDRRVNFVAWNKSSGGAAVNVAYHLGASTVVLLGYDMRRVKMKVQGKKVERANWHEDHPAPNKDPYERFLLPWKRVLKDASRLGMQIINCTPESALTVFPSMTLEEFLDNEKISVAG